MHVFACLRYVWCTLCKLAALRYTHDTLLAVVYMRKSRYIPTCMQRYAPVGITLSMCWCFVHLGCCSMHAGPASDASLPGAEDMVIGKLIAVRRADLQRSLMSLQVIACELGPRNTCCTNLTCWRWENKMGATEQSSAALDCSFDPLTLTGATKYKSLEAHIEMESGSKELPEAMNQTSTKTHACSFLLKLLTFQLRPCRPSSTPTDVRSTSRTAQWAYTGRRVPYTAGYCFQYRAESLSAIGY